MINVPGVKDLWYSQKKVDHEFFIRRTIALAARAKGRTSPNPMVGAVVVDRGRIISEGYHEKAGMPHAEAIALERAGPRARGATLYSSLEPCCHLDKRTPPCTEKIISSGIRRVVVAMKDPNPKVAGKGIERLTEAGLEVLSGILEGRARELNEFYIKHVETGRPFVILKVAMTLDGKIATPEGESRWITGEEARLAVHKIRGRVDAVLTAIGTVKADNPRLTCRTWRGRNPKRVIIDPSLEIPANACALSTPPETILVVRKTQRGSPEEKKKLGLMQRGIGFIEYGTKKIDLKSLMRRLGESGIISVLIEGGSSLNSYCLEAGIVDKVMFFIAPKIIGGRASFPSVGGAAFRTLEKALRIEDLKIRRFGDDILLEGYIGREGK